MKISELPCLMMATWFMVINAGKCGMHSGVQDGLIAGLNAINDSTTITNRLTGIIIIN